MQTASNPEALSSQNAEVSSPTVLSLCELGKESPQWTLTLHPHHLALAEGSDPQPFIIVREEMMKSATLMEGIPAFVLQKPKKLTFKLNPATAETLAEWIGKPVLAATYLKRRYGWILPIAVVWILGALPIGSNPNVGPNGLPLDPVGLIMGFTLVISWALAKWRPHPALFLVDAIWFSVMAARLIKDVFIDGRSKGWLVLAVLLGWMVVSGVKHYIRFKDTKIQPNPR